MTSASNTAAQPLSRHEYTCLLLELALLWLIARFYQLDSAHLLPTALAIVSIGFAVHAQLPPRLRQPWFLAISLACLVLVLGVAHAALVCVLGAIVLAIATANLPWRLQLLLLGMAAAGIMGFRSSLPLPAWATFGSIFMFRLVSFLYCIHHERTPAGGLMAWSYFFLPPNAFFLLFPVVDYTTYRQSYYSSDRRRIYQSGVHWIAVGVAELLIYRLIKNELLPDPLEIRTLRSLAAFLALNYGLYVYVSGTFHIICGILHLFGFDLPRTHDNYFLASSFTDIWRRINIYWKDFLMKVFFLPAFYALRSRGARLAIALAVLWVFIWTWLAHAWQQFWLLGLFPLRLNEGVLWGVAGMAVAMNSILDYRPRRRRDAAPHPFANGAIQGFKVAIVFSCVSIFWSHWTHPEVSQLMVAAIVDRIRSRGSPVWLTISGIDVAALTAFVVLAMLIGGLWSFFTANGSRRSQSLRDRFSGITHPSFDLSVGRHVAPLVLMLLLSQLSTIPQLSGGFWRVVTGLQSERATRGEALAMVNGYYEQLSAGSAHAGPLLQASHPAESREIYVFGEMTRRRDDVLEFDLIPGWTGSYGGAPLSINRWGMRDVDRSLEEPPGTFRIALVGSSVIMGAGVRDHETFAQLLETQLNAESGRDDRRFEVLNFGMGQTSAIQRRALIQRRVAKFSPDVIIYFAHQDELDAPLQRMATAITGGTDLEDDCLARIIRDLQIPADSPEVLIFAKANEVLDRVLDCTYHAIADAARAARSRALFAYLPMPTTEPTTFEPEKVLTLAKKAGLETADLSNWQQGKSAEEVLVSLRDHHPNPLGHKLIAARVRELLQGEPFRIVGQKQQNP